MACLRVRDKLNDDFGVRSCLEICALALETCTNVAKVHQVAVVGNGDKALGGIHADGLCIQQGRIASGGVPRMPNGHWAGELGKHIFREDFAHQAHTLDVGQPISVGAGDAR